MAELKPTYGDFRLRGEVVWKNRDGAYREDVTASGYPFRSLRFGVKTDDNNIVEVDFFQTKFDNITLQNIETRNRDKSVPYGEHHNLPDGYRLFMPTRLGIEKDENGENLKKELIPYDAIKYVNEKLQNGDTVFIYGQPRFSEYTTRDGDVVQQARFEPAGIYLSSTPYDDDDFEGESIFKQEIILNRTEKNGSILDVHAYIVTNKDGAFIPYRFFIDIEKYKKFAMTMHKLKFGTVLKVEGYIHSTVKIEEIKEDDAWGESPIKNTVPRVEKSLEITKAHKPSKKDIGKYSQKDFIPKEEKEENIDNPFQAVEEEDAWGESPSESHSNSFDDNYDDPFA